ncbi:hypothetical protein ACQP3C_31220, partial [Escherichia coli]
MIPVDQKKFKDIPGYILSYRAVWATQDPVSEKLNKNDKIASSIRKTLKQSFSYRKRTSTNSKTN